MGTDLLQEADSSTQRRRHLAASRVVNLGLGANAVLATAKTAAGILGHSQALLADGINSISDVAYYLLVKLLVKQSQRPADREHPYGHHQYESIAAVVIGAFVITTGIAVFWDAVNACYDILAGAEDPRAIRTFTLAVALATVLVKLLLTLQARAVSRQWGNAAVSALARDHRNDIWSSLGAAVGITFGLLGFRWVDPVAGAVVALVIAKTGTDILRESAAELMDTVPDRQMEGQIRSVLSGFPQIRSTESIHTHRFGPYYMANLTVGIDGDLTVCEGDAIADAVEKRLSDEVDLLRRVYIHYHPTR